MLRTFLPIALLLISLSALSQTEDNLKVRLKQIQTNNLKNLEVSTDTSRVLDSLIVVAGAQYRKTLTKREYDLIVANYTALVNEVNKEKVVKTAGSSKYVVNQQSFLRAKISICPLYPFCSSR